MKTPGADVSGVFLCICLLLPQMFAILKTELFYRHGSNVFLMKI